MNEALDAVGESERILGWPKQQRALFRDLLIQPQLVWYLNQLMGHGFRLDRAPRLLGLGQGDDRGGLAGGDAVHHYGR